MVSSPINKILGNDENKEIIRTALKKNVPVLLIGETGTGKTSIIREIAHDMNQQYLRINLNGQTSVDEFVGKWLIRDGETYWVDGVLTMAMRKGSILLIDEINAALPEILFVLHSLLDDDKKILLTEKDGELVIPHPDFRLVATCNPTEEYVGTKELNKAFMSRFGCVLQFNYPTEKIESKILQERTNICKFDADGLAYFAKEVRKLRSNDDIYFTLSTRDLIFWGSFLEDLGAIESFKVTVLNKASEEDKEELVKMFNTVFTGPSAKFGPSKKEDVSKATMKPRK